MSDHEGVQILASDPNLNFSLYTAAAKASASGGALSSAADAARKAATWTTRAGTAAQASLRTVSTEQGAKDAAALADGVGSVRAGEGLGGGQLREEFANNLMGYVTRYWPSTSRGRICRGRAAVDGGADRQGEERGRGRNVGEDG